MSFAVHYTQKIALLISAGKRTGTTSRIGPNTSVVAGEKRSASVVEQWSLGGDAAATLTADSKLLSLPSESKPAGSGCYIGERRCRYCQNGFAFGHQDTSTPLL